MKKICLLFIAWGFLWPAMAQEVPEPVADWVFHPNYMLPRNAANYPGERIDAPESEFARMRLMGPPIWLYGHAPTERKTDLMHGKEIPRNAFSVEGWILNHVNQPVGSMIAARGRSLEEPVSWLLGYHHDSVFLRLTPDEKPPVELNVSLERGWKKYWLHVVGTFDGEVARLFVNGKEAATQTLGKTALQWSDAPQVEVAGYFEWEPKMEVHNLLKAARIYDQPLNKEQINSRFKALQTQVEAGHLFAETFHFTAGPYLHYATTQSINLLWETDRPATAEIRYGTSLPLTEKRTLDDPAFIQEITLEGLEAGRPYYYEIETNSQDGQKMSSGLLTFSPAPDTRAAISFCIIGDTESRPHINHRLGEMIWEERPNFVMHLGDVTDGGMEDHKFEWTYEYFTGITPLASRIPIFTVPGNGEKDLYWYKKYHRLPGEEAFYKFRYGDAEFFMLNSNANEELVEGGKQYDWLKKALAQSTATWKFVAHHHCPYSSDENDFGDTWAGKSSSQSDPKFGDLKKLYQSAGVDVVFYGHVHAFERSWPLTDGQVDTENGVVYIKSGGAGGHLEDFSPTPTWFSQKVQRGHHYCKVDIYRGKFVFRMYDLEGRLKDFWEWDK